MSLYAKILTLSYDSAAAIKGTALKSYWRSVRLIKEAGTVNPLADSAITNILLNGRCLDPENRNLYVFYIDTFFGSAWIIEINIDTRVQTVVYYDQYNAIGFNPDYKIYNAKVVHGRIVWTDNLNPIYQMDIERAKKSFYHQIGYGLYPDIEEWDATASYSTDQIVSDGNKFYKSIIDSNTGNEPKIDDGTHWTDLNCLIEDAYYSMDVKNFYLEAMPPTHPPEVTYRSDDTRKINNLRQTLFQFAYRYVYMDWRKSTFSPASIVPVPQAEEETATGLANEMISLNNKLQIIVNSGGEEVRAVEVIARSSDDKSKWYLIETINKFDTQERGMEISRTSEPGYIQLAITIPAPTVTNVERPDAPVAAAATAMSINSFTANWDVVTTATGYSIDVSTSNTFASFLPGYENLDVGDVLTLNITGLTEEDQYNTYYYRVRAYNVGGISDNSNMITTHTVATAPLPPLNIASINIFGNRFTANWNASPSLNALQYYIDVSVDPTFASFVSGYNNKSVGTDVFITISGLTHDTTYYTRVRTWASDGQLSINSNVITTVTTSALGAPVADDATDVAQTAFRMNWEAVSGAQGYRYDVATDILFTALVKDNQITPDGATSILINTELSANTTYYYRVRAYLGVEISANSNTITVATLPNAPAAPVPTAGTNMDQSSFSANWGAAATATGYKIDVSTSPNFISFVSGYENLDVGNVLGHGITGLPERIIYTSYYYRIRAYNTGGTSANSTTITVATLPLGPSAPIAQTAINVFQTRFTANWINSASPTAIGNYLDVATDSAFTSFVAGYENKNVGTVLNHTIIGLTENTTYYYRMRAYTSTGMVSVNSNIITVVTTSSPDPPVAIVATNVLQTSFTANWQPSVGATSYKIDVSTDPVFGSFIFGFENKWTPDYAESISVTLLTAGTTYYYRVRAYATGETSISSNVITVITAT